MFFFVPTNLNRDSPNGKVGGSTEIEKLGWKPFYLWKKIELFLSQEVENGRRWYHYYIIPFCEALKMGLGGGRVPGPPRLIGAGPPAAQLPRLTD